MMNKCCIYRRMALVFFLMLGIVKGSGGFCIINC